MSAALILNSWAAQFAAPFSLHAPSRGRIETKGLPELPTTPDRISADRSGADTPPAPAGNGVATDPLSGLLGGIRGLRDSVGELFAAHAEHLRVTTRRHIRNALMLAVGGVCAFVLAVIGLIFAALGAASALSDWTGSVAAGYALTGLAFLVLTAVAAQIAARAGRTHDPRKPLDPQQERHNV